jgi:hypothetical protein
MVRGLFAAAGALPQPRPGALLLDPGKGMIPLHLAVGDVDSGIVGCYLLVTFVVLGILSCILMHRSVLKLEKKTRVLIADTEFA